MDKLVNDQSKGSATPRYAQPNANAKRATIDSDSDDSPLQTPKRVADSKSINSSSNNQTIANVMFNLNKSLSKSSTLDHHKCKCAHNQQNCTSHQPNKDQPPSSTQPIYQKTSTTNTMHPDQTENEGLKTDYTIPVTNTFDPLSSLSNAIDNNITNMQGVRKSAKIPPITIVGAVNFTNALKILNADAPNSVFTIKYMSIGTKISLSDITVYNNLKTKLISENIEFFSHDISSEKIDKYILSGIPKFSIEEIIESLSKYQVEPLEVRAMDQKTKRFDDEGAFIVSFKQGSTKMNNLTKVRINYVIPKWRPFVKSSNIITQCRRCQIFGHGMRNCNLNPRCCYCGLAHLAENCNSPIHKCANCKGDHPSTSVDCPKRKQFIEMRKKLASANNNKSAKPTPAPRNNLQNFPNMAKPSTTENTNSTYVSNHAQPIDWTKLFTNHTTPPLPQTTAAPNDKFRPDEIGPIMIEVLSGLRNCQNKEQQLILMFDIATKYIYNVGP